MEYTHAPPPPAPLPPRVPCPCNANASCFLRFPSRPRSPTPSLSIMEVSDAPSVMTDMNM